MQGSSQLVKTLFDKLVDGGHVPRHYHPPSELHRVASDTMQFRKEAFFQIEAITSLIKNQLRGRRTRLRTETVAPSAGFGSTGLESEGFARAGRACHQQRRDCYAGHD